MIVALPGFFSNLFVRIQEMMLLQNGGCCAQDSVRGTFILYSNLGYRNGTILAIFYFYVAPYASHQVSAQSNLAIPNLSKIQMPPVKFQLIPQTV